MKSTYSPESHNHLLPDNRKASILFDFKGCGKLPITSNPVDLYNISWFTKICNIDDGLYIQLCYQSNLKFVKGDCGAKIDLIIEHDDKIVFNKNYKKNFRTKDGVFYLIKENIQDYVNPMYKYKVICHITITAYMGRQQFEPKILDVNRLHSNNVVLIVDNKERVVVNPLFLAFHSPIFYDIFIGENKSFNFPEERGLCFEIWKKIDQINQNFWVRSIKFVTYWSFIIIYYIFYSITMFSVLVYHWTVVSNSEEETKKEEIVKQGNEDLEDNKSLKEYQISGVTRNELIELLNVLSSHCPERVNKVNCTVLLRISKLFKIQNVRDQCETYLMNTYDFTEAELFKIVDENDLFQLLDKLISKYPTFSAFSEKCSEICRSLSPTTKGHIMDAYLNNL